MKQIAIEDLDNFRFATTLACNFDIYPGKALLAIATIQRERGDLLYMVKSYKGSTVKLELETTILQDAINKYNEL